MMRVRLSLAAGSADRYIQSSLGPMLERSRRWTMRVSDIVVCETFPCDDLNQEAYRIPDIDLSAESMRIAMIAEVPPADPLEDLYAGNEALIARYHPAGLCRCRPGGGID